MAKVVQKITLSASRDIPFNKLILSQANVRHVKAGVSIEELADDIARRTLLQSITVRPVLDTDGAETGMFEIPAGGRRYRALELLVKQKRLARTAPIPCVVRTEGLAEEDSLAENIQRAPLHPLDQFRAFLTMREKGRTEEEIAAAFFVSVAVVKQRLRLASVSPTLLEVYAEDGMSLDQLMAFTVSPDHERQEQIWEAIQRSYNKDPYNIRRLLTEGAVRASDKRARYASEAYASAGGALLRDLFQSDDGGWLQDVALLERLVAEKLDHDAEAIRAEGWKWVEAATDLPYGRTYSLRLIAGEQPPLSEEQAATLSALKAEAEQIEATYDAAEELPEDADRRLGEIEALIAEIEDLPMVYDPDEIARAGAFVSLDGTGELRIERGYVRPEDEPPVASTTAASDVENEAADPRSQAADSTSPVTAVADQEAVDEDEGVRPLSDKLLSELTAHRTLALRDAIGAHPAIAFAAVLHALCLKLFYRYGLDSCLDIDAKSATLSGHAPGLADTRSAARIDARHRSWAERMPKEPSDLWAVLIGLDAESQEALFAHCASLTINAVHEAWNRRPRAMVHASRLAAAVSLSMVEAGWSATADNFFGRVTKARILEAVREAKGEAYAERIAHLKKTDMAVQAEQILAGSGWLPEPLRSPGEGTSSSTVDASQHEADTPLNQPTPTEDATVGGPEADQFDPADGSTDRRVAAE